MKKNTVHTISMEGVTLRNYPQLIPGLCLQHSQAIYDNMTAEQRERLCQMAIGIALQGELTRHLPFVPHHFCGRRAGFVGHGTRN